MPLHGPTSVGPHIDICTMGNDLPNIGNAELELLLHLADAGPQSVRALHDSYGTTKGIGRTTVLKTVERLLQKGYVERHDIDGTWQYRSVRTRQELEQRMVHRFVEDTLGGTVHPFMAYLHGQKKLAPNDVEVLRALLEKLDAEEKNK